MPASVEYAVKTEGLTKIYQGRHIALSGVNLELEPGTILGVLGPNGAGKTTLVKLLLGLQRPTAGKALILGKRMTPNAAALRRRMGYLPADPTFPQSMSALDYLDYVGRLSGLLRDSRRPRVASLIRAVDLLKVSGEPIGRLSTGHRTRLAIAASLINDPEVIIWDEPARGLDPTARRGMLDLMRQLGEQKTLLFCSHNLSDAHEVCSRAIVLQEGHVIHQGDLAELAKDLRPSQVEIFLQGDKREIADTVRSIGEFEELERCELQKNVLKLTIKSNTSHATALANVLVTLADHHIEMTDLRVSGLTTESALSELTWKEKSRGLTRAYQPTAA